MATAQGAIRGPPTSPPIGGLLGARLKAIGRPGAILAPCPSPGRDAPGRTSRLTPGMSHWSPPHRGWRTPVHRSYHAHRCLRRGLRPFRDGGQPRRQRSRVRTSSVCHCRIRAASPCSSLTPARLRSPGPRCPENHESPDRDDGHVVSVGASTNGELTGVLERVARPWLPRANVVLCELGSVAEFGCSAWWAVDGDRRWIDAVWVLTHKRAPALSELSGAAAAFYAVQHPSPSSAGTDRDVAPRRVQAAETVTRPIGWNGHPWSVRPRSNGRLTQPGEPTWEPAVVITAGSRNHCRATGR
jgi:hypothetical protein